MMRIVLILSATLFLCLVGSNVALAQEDASASASEEQVQTLFEKLKPEAVLRVTFTETLKLPFLTDSLVSKGVLTLNASGLMLRQVKSPKSSTTAIAGAQLVSKDASGVTRIDLDANPQAAGAISLLRALVVGDLDALEKNYRIESSSDEGKAWTIRLTPRSEGKSFFTSCEVRTDESSIRRIVLEESDGATREMTFGDAQRLDELPSSDRKTLSELGVGDGQ